MGLYFFKKWLAILGRICYNTAMKMTRSHFQALAELTAGIQFTLDLTKPQCIELEDLILEMCKRANPKFKPERFMKAVEKARI